MKTFWICTAIVIACALAEYVIPGALYHAGWFNTVVIALAVVAVLAARSIARALPAKSFGLMLAAGGCAVVALAVGASGLFAPDSREVPDVPGMNAHLEDFGRAYETHRLFHTGVRVEAYDARGAHLTITQPSGTVFLSPLLLMNGRQNINGTDLPFDTFAVPAAHRLVHAVLFTARNGVVFAVDDDEDRPIPGAIALGHDGELVSVGGLRLRGFVINYPAILIDAVPLPLATGIGLALLIGAVVILRRTPWISESLAAVNSDARSPKG